MKKIPVLFLIPFFLACQKKDCYQCQISSITIYNEPHADSDKNYKLTYPCGLTETQIQDFEQKHTYTSTFINEWGTSVTVINRCGCIKN